MSVLAVPGTATPQAALPVGDERRRSPVPYLLLLPGLAWLAVFFVVPMIALGSQSLQEGSIEDGYTLTWHWQTYTDALAQYWPQFLRAFWYAALATVFALLISYPLAYTIAFKSGRWRNVWLVLVIAPFFTSFLIRTIAWKTILADNGVVAEVMRGLGLLNWTDDRLLSTGPAVVAGLTYNFLPFMTLPIYAALERMDRRVVEAAHDLYASPFTAFRKVTVPLSMPGVVAGTLLTFIPAAGDYINQRLLGSSQNNVIGSVIDTEFIRVGDYPTAAALSFVLMISIVALVVVYVRRAGTEELV
ncbi:MAG: ABC transporter permease [Pseudonocardiaceae bacterium]